MVLITIGLTLFTSFFFTLFNREVTELCKKIRQKPFESFVVMGLCAVIAILYKAFL